MSEPKYKIGDAIHGWKVTRVKWLETNNQWHYSFINNGNKMSGTELVIDAVFTNYANSTKEING